MKLPEILNDKQKESFYSKGFTLTETLLTLAIVSILIVTAVPIFGNLQVNNQLTEAQDRLRQTFRLAQTRSIAGLNNSSHGVYIDINIGAPDNVILYQGDSYATRDTDYDRVEEISEVMFLSTSILGNDINFTRPTGKPSATGTITISHTVSGVSTTTITSIGSVLNQ